MPDTSPSRVSVVAYPVSGGYVAHVDHLARRDYIGAPTLTEAVTLAVAFVRAAGPGRLVLDLSGVEA